MKKVLFGSLICLFVFNGLASAKRSFDIVVEPRLTVGGGNNKYVLDETGYLDSARTIIGHVKSELIFPLDVQYGGLDFGIRSNSRSRFEWSVMASYTISLSDPGGKMYDRDWINWPGTFYGLTSYSESNVQQSSHSGTIEGRISVVKFPKVSAGLVAGLQFQKFSQDIIDLDAFQVDPSTRAEAVFSMVGNVGYYSVTWKTPYGGVYGSVKPIRPLDLNLMLAFAPTWVYDKDLHLLRNREAWASGNGTGFIARAKAEFGFGKTGQKVRPMIGLSADWYSFAVKGTQTIHWYGDDSATPGFNDTGSTSYGVPHQMTSKQFNLNLNVGVRF